jgi:hypothetical protein
MQNGIFDLAISKTALAACFTVFNENLTAKSEKRSLDFRHKVTFAAIFVKKTKILDIIYLI